ncbi:MAG: Na+/H+ antiporter NhaC family protein [Phascolarctobacterium sp.]|nr:Na+/H+ antiporter NhaC family protein [Phascolarctobacterium sp.]
MSLLWGYSIVYALLVGLFIFSVHAKLKGFTLTEIFSMCKNGIWTARNVLFTFLLIGLLTATWRGAGTIAVLVSYAISVVSPSIFILGCFLLNCLVSVLTGTSFGTCATMGVICMTMANAMHISTEITAGAIVSGIFYGDRCSPVSTSALLVAELTNTNIFDNIKKMFRTAFVPTVLVSAIYLGLGIFIPYEETSLDLVTLFSKEFNMHYLALLPAIVIFSLSLLRVPVKKTMFASILTAVLLCLFLQNIPLPELTQYAIYGYEAKHSDVAVMINGGGVLSMVKAGVIICISSCYAGIFAKTKLLEPLQAFIMKISQKFTAFGAVLFTSALTSAIACNQTLGIMLTNQLCKDVEPDNKKLAIDLEDTVVLVAALYPWSIALAIPLATIEATPASVLFAFFLYVLPLWNLIIELFGRKRI